MFVPDGEGKTFFIRINKYIIRSIVLFVVVFAIGIAFLLIKTGTIGARLQYAFSLLEENKHLKEENKQLYTIVEKFRTIERTTEYLRRLAYSTGEGALIAAAPRVSRTGKDALFAEDSIDKFYKEMRTTEAFVSAGENQKAKVFQPVSYYIPNITPVDGWITKHFAEDTLQGKHPGIDIAATQGTPLRTTAPGIVDEIVNDPMYGLMVSIKHNYGFKTRYAHCLQVLVSKGQHVERGQTIALLGNTGRSSAPHVHYEIMKDEKYIDPLKYIFSSLN